MFPNGHHYATNFNQSQQTSSEQRPYAQLESSSQSLHRGSNQGQNQGYPSNLYSRQHHYGSTTSLSGESPAKYEYRWGDGTHTNITGQTHHQGRDPSGSYHESHNQETHVTQARSEPQYDTRGLGSLAYASGLEVAALSTSRPVSTATTNYPLPATTAPESYHRDPPSLGSVPSARDTTSSNQLPLTPSNNSYANGGVTYSQPSKGPHSLPSIHQSYQVSEMGNTLSTRQGTSQPVHPKSGNDRIENSKRNSTDRGSEQVQRGGAIQHSDRTPSYQGYQPSQSTSSLHQGRSDPVTESHLQRNHRGSQVFSHKPVTSEPPYTTPQPSKSPDQLNAAGTARYNQSAQNGQGRSNETAPALEPRTASPFYIRQYQSHHSRFSPLHQTPTTQGHSGHNTATASIPTTVDPSHVYNPQHEYRRQAAAAEAKSAERTARQVADAITPSPAVDKTGPAGRATPNSNLHRTVTSPVASFSNMPAPNEGATVHAGAASQNTPTVSEAHLLQESEEEDMELQMRVMVEKMRKYQAMDPSRFAKVWEEVKKGPSQNSTPTQGGLQQSSGTGQPSNLQRTLPVSAQQGVSMQTQSENTVQLGQTPEMNVKASQALPTAAQRGMKAKAQTQKGNKPAKEAASPVSARKSKSRSKSSASMASDNLTRQSLTPQVARGAASSVAEATPAATNGSSLQPPRTVTHWPESKKAVLSNAAVKALTSNPENAGISIDVEFVNGILDQNPSYIELCQILENMGFKLGRSRFAKSLLAAVPDTSPRPTESGLRQPPDARPMSSVHPEIHQTQAAPAEISTSPAHSIPKAADTSVNSSAHKEHKVPRKSAGKSPGRPRKDGTSAQPRTKLGGPPVSPYQPQQISAPSQSVAVANSLQADQRNDDLMLTSQTMPHGDASSAGLILAEKQSPLVSQQATTATPATSQGSAARKYKQPLGSGDLAKSDADGFGSKTLPETQLKSLSKPGGNADSKADQLSSKIMPEAQTQLKGALEIGNGANNKVDQVISTTAGGSTFASTQQQTPTVPIGNSQVTPQPRTMSKKEACRKRTFAEIVDLTEINSDEEIYPGRVTKSPRTNGQTVVSRAVIPSPQGNGSPQNEKQMSHNEGAGQSTGNGSNSPFPIAQASQHSLSGIGLVRAFRRENALRRSTYDPRTIARDVLIASGRHPRMRGLNEHLDRLKANFASVTNSADLNTFRWDIVDPDGPTSGAGQNHGGNKQAVKSNKVQEVVDVSGTDISTRNENGGALQAWSASKRTEVAQGVSGASSVAGAAPASMSNRSTKTSLTLSQKRPHEPESESDSDSLPHASSSSAQAVHKRIRLSVGQVNSSSRPVASEGPTNSSLKLQYSSISPTRGSKAYGQSIAPRNQRNLIQRQNQNSNSRTPQPKPSSNIAVVIYTPPTNGNKVSNPARDSRRRKEVEEPAATEDLSATDDDGDPADWEPIPIPIYKCEWTNCEAELRSLKVLRQHIMKVHKPTTTRGILQCSWEGCMKVVKDGDNKNAPFYQPYLFGSEKSWFEHVNKQHVEEYAWKYGDDPLTVREGDNPDDPPYFKDAMGRRFAPTEAEIVSDKLRTAVGRGYLPNEGWFRAHQMVTRSQKRQAILDSISEAQRRSDNTGQDIGAAVCRGGPRFVTPALRRSFVSKMHTEIVDRV